MTSPRATASVTINSSAPARRDIPARRRGPGLPLSSEQFACVSFVASGVALCRLPNRALCRRQGLGEREEQLFLESWREKNCLCSGGSALRSGPIRRRRTCRRAPAAPSGQRTSTSPAIASLLTKRSWSCSTNYGPAGGHDLQGLPSPATVRADARSVKVEGQLVLGRSQRKGETVRAVCCWHPLAPSVSPASVSTDKDVLRPPTMSCHGWASSVRRETARRSTRSVRASAAGRASLAAGDRWGAGDGRVDPIRFLRSSTSYGLASGLDGRALG